jgi:NAD(P)-dependent dehydrogenase (short-subunit alcohol dehydrogenase family)
LTEATNCFSTIELVKMRAEGGAIAQESFWWDCKRRLRSLLIPYLLAITVLFLGAYLGNSSSWAVVGVWSFTLLVLWTLGWAVITLFYFLPKWWEDWRTVSRFISLNSLFADERRAPGMHNRACIVVTGASSGIGQATAERLVWLGFTVFATVRTIHQAKQMLLHLYNVDESKYLSPRQPLEEGLHCRLIKNPHSVCGYEGVILKLNRSSLFRGRTSREEKKENEKEKEKETLELDELAQDWVDILKEGTPVSRFIPVLMELEDEGSIDEACQMIEKELSAFHPSDSLEGEYHGFLTQGGLVGLINNAGFALPGPFELLPLDKVREQMEVNVLGQLALTQRLIPLLRKSKGRIVNMGSVSGRMPMDLLGAYAASKFALQAITQTLDKEFDPFGMRCVSIEPSSYKSYIWRRGRAILDEYSVRVPQHQLALYKHSLQNLKALASTMDEWGSYPSAVVEAVVDALCSRCPKRRYLVGEKAVIVALISIVCSLPHPLDELAYWLTSIWLR